MCVCVCVCGRGYVCRVVVHYYRLGFYLLLTLKHTHTQRHRINIWGSKPVVGRFIMLKRLIV